jgi:hypothetical protein
MMPVKAATATSETTSQGIEISRSELSASSQREGRVSSPVPSGVSRLVVPFGIVSITLTEAPVLRASLEQTIPWAGFMFATVAV